MDLSDRHISRLQEIKENIETAYMHFRNNGERYHEFMEFVFSTSITSRDRATLDSIKKPPIEFNILESIVNRQIGEFAKQEPSITVHADDGMPIEKMTPAFLEMIKVLEAHMRESILDSANDGFQSKVLKQCLGGGYSVVEIMIEWASELSFQKKIVTRPVFDPTLTGFDPLARESHKGDGQYCFQLYPKTKKEMIEDYGKDIVKDVKFCRSVGDFSWSYNDSDKRDVMLVCDYYEKKRKKVKLLEVAGMGLILERDYKRAMEDWDKQGFIEQYPAVVDERWTYLEHIVRYQLCETKVLAYDETDYKYLPLIFIDGNSVELKRGLNDGKGQSGTGTCGQMTRPYVYHAKGIQQLRNYAGQTIGSEIENMVVHKWIACLESINKDQVTAFQNPQQMETVLYNAFLNGDPTIPLPPPREVQRTPTPPLVESIFMGSDIVTQTILGSYDSTLGTNQKDISGVAIANGAVQTAAAASPYLMNYIKGLNRICEINVDLIPKYYRTPRTIPIKQPDGKRSYQIINEKQPEKQNPMLPGQEGMQQGMEGNAEIAGGAEGGVESMQQSKSVDMFYMPHELGVRVEAGVNTNIQKQVALDQIIRMMQSSELFAQFINANGLEIILDNLDIRGIEGMKVAAAQFMEAQKKAQEAAAQKPDPQTQMLEMAAEVERNKTEQAREKAEDDMTIQAGKLAIENMKVQAQVAEIEAKIKLLEGNAYMAEEKLVHEQVHQAVGTALEVSRHNQELRAEEQAAKEAQDAQSEGQQAPVQ